MTLLALIPIIIILCFGAWRAALIVLGIALFLDLLIALLRVGVRATLSEGVFSLKILAGPVKLIILPKDEEKAKKPKKEKPIKEKSKKEEKPQEEKPEAEEKPKLKITMDLVRIILSAVGDALGRLRRKLSIDRLTVHYTVAAEDPCSAALTFGYASAAVNALMPVIENVFNVRERDVGAEVTFERQKSQIFLDAQLTLAIWEILYIALAVWPVVKAVIAQYMNTRKVDKNGQSSDQ